MGALAVGFNLAGPTAWLAALDPHGQLLADPLDRVQLREAQLGGPRALSEFLESVEALVARLEVQYVVLVRLGSGTRLSPTDLRRRGSLECCLMLAANRCRAQFAAVTQQALAKRFGAKLSESSFRTRVAEVTGSSTPTRWAERCPALAGAYLTWEIASG